MFHVTIVKNAPRAVPYPIASATMVKEAQGAFFMKEIQLSNGLSTFVDDEDYERLSVYKWYVLSRKNSQTKYAVATYNENGKTKSILMHRFILGVGRGQPFVDHKDGNGLNNTRGNLRLASNTQNTRNRKKHKSSKYPYKGIQRSTKGEWRASIVIEGKQKRFGCFYTPEEAAMEYDRLAILHYGEFARLNFPDKESIDKAKALAEKNREKSKQEIYLIRKAINAKQYTKRKELSKTERTHSREILIALYGEVKPLSKWCKLFNLPNGTIHNRIFRQKMSPTDAFLASYDFIKAQ